MAFFSHDSYSAIAQKTEDNETTVSWAAVHVIGKYNITSQSYDFIQLAKNNRYCFVCFSIAKRVFEKNDGLNPSDFRNYVLYAFDTEEELYRICETTKTDAARFTQTWHCEYPFD